MIDTLSKFSAGLDENSNAEVSAFLGKLAQRLRDAIGCTVLLVCHTGHGDGKRPRGASALMANPDAEYMVERPDPLGMTITVTRERFKDYAALPPLAYTARVVELGRVTSYGEPVTSLVLDQVEPPAPASAKGRKGHGATQERAVAGFKEWLRAHPSDNHISTVDMTALLKAQGVTARQRRHDAIRYLIELRILTTAVGGYSIDRVTPL